MMVNPQLPKVTTPMYQIPGPLCFPHPPNIEIPTAILSPPSRSVNQPADSHSKINPNNFPPTSPDPKLLSPTTKQPNQNIPSKSITPTTSALYRREIAYPHQQHRNGHYPRVTYTRPIPIPIHSLSPSSLHHVLQIPYPSTVLLCSIYHPLPSP